MTMPALSIRNRMMPYRRVYMEEPIQIAVPYQEHSRIVEMILGRESDAAEVSFKEHSSISADGVSNFISALNRKFRDLESKI
ncbi:MAG: hypothetical protein HOF23_14580 [Rhodospirillaceae bacterium]|jgi:DNA-binding FadR family transcriptional regulator|nr:hypothetical protein [Rhodospirillaceae bacterium]